MNKNQSISALRVLNKWIDAFENDKRSRKTIDPNDPDELDLLLWLADREAKRINAGEEPKEEKKENNPVVSEWQLCPICQGAKRLPPAAGSSSASFIVCDTCSGQGMIAKPVLFFPDVKIQKTTDVLFRTGIDELNDKISEQDIHEEAKRAANVKYNNGDAGGIDLNTLNSFIFGARLAVLGKFTDTGFPLNSTYIKEGYDFAAGKILKGE